MKTLIELLNDHLDLGRSLKISRHTIRSASYQNKSFLKWLSENTAITTPDRLRTAHLEAWQKYMSLRRTRKGLVARQSHSSLMIPIRSAIRGCFHFRLNLSLLSRINSARV